MNFQPIDSENSTPYHRRAGAHALPFLLALLIMLAWVAPSRATETTGTDPDKISWLSLPGGLSGSFTVNFPLTESPPAEVVEGSATQGENGDKTTLRATIKYSPRSYWYIETTLFKYINSRYKASWDPDFSYGFGYDDWHPYTFSLTYENTGGNRFSPNRAKGEAHTRFKNGVVSLGWKFVLPERWEKPLLVHPSGGLHGEIHSNLTPEYFDLSRIRDRNWKHSISLDLKYFIYTYWYMQTTLFFYPDQSQQQPWDPDYTYGFGYDDWHPGTFSLEYTNYSGTRFPGRTRTPDTGRFRDGAISISWSWAL